MIANSVTSSTYMSILRHIYFDRKWLMLSLPVIVCLIFIAVDARFAYVALIVAMGTIMVALPLIYYYGLTQESRWSILEKTITTSNDGILLNFTSDKMQQHLISWNDIADTTAVSNCLVLRLKKNRYTFLAIPLKAFENEDELRDFVLTIHNRIGNTPTR